MYPIILSFILTLMTTDTATATQFTVRELPYAYDALAPQVSEETLRFHHDKHYKGYVDKLNELLVDSPYAGRTLEEIIISSDGPLFNNAAQAWNHEFYFAQFSPEPQRMPSGELLDAINTAFGSVDKLKERMNAESAALFGSGWVWLASNYDGEVMIVPKPNAGNPLTDELRPLLAIDVWEHAYYIDFRNARADGVKALWSVLDWRKVEERYAAK